MWSGVRLGLFGSCLALALGASPPSYAAPTASRGPLSALVEGDCALCHTIPGVAEPDRTESCSGCHAWVWSITANPAARARALELFPLWSRYEHSVRSYASVPALDVAAARLEPAWIEAWLRDPHDLRPQMPETMVRVGLDDQELAEIAAWSGAHLAPVPPTTTPSPANLDAGERLFVQRGCAACHSFGGRHTIAAMPGAPDLQYTRERMNNDRIVAWILDPKRVAAGATMPAMGLSRAEAIAVRDYLVLADPRAPEMDQRPPPLPVITRAVSWAEVEEKVFGRICVHCHMDPPQNDGRAGPGNAGGFGWPASGIELQTEAGVRAHGDAVVAAMLRRRDEQNRDLVTPGSRAARLERPEQPGMPLGLPPIPDEDLALVVAWLRSPTTK